MLLLSFFLWALLLWYGVNHPNKVKRLSEMGGGGGSDEVTTHTYYYYKLKFPHNSIDPSQSISLYDSFGTLIYTLPPYYQYMNYGTGTLSIPGSEQNTVIESISTASYYVFYSSSDLIIDYDKSEFKISKSLIKTIAETKVQGTFEYYSIITAFKDIASVIDGRWDTQVQTEFFSEPPTGYNYSILDLGSIKTIQALDIVAGFYKPDSLRKFDVNFNLTLHYSLNGTDYYNISDATHNFQLSGGEKISFEESDLGIDFKARYLKMILENVDRVNYGQTKDANGTVILNGIYVVALTEIAAYDDIVLKADSKLIAYTTLTSDIDINSGMSSGSYPATVAVSSTEGFTSTGNAYILNTDGTYDAFTYTGITSTSFTGVTGLAESHSQADEVVQSIRTGADVYDYRTIRPKLGERIYKLNKVNDSLLFTQTLLDSLAKAYQEEFLKNHTKAQIELLYAPHLEVGHTIKVVSTHNQISQNMFIESISDNNGIYSITVAFYPNL